MKLTHRLRCTRDVGHKGRTQLDGPMMDLDAKHDGFCAIAHWLGNPAGNLIPGVPKMSHLGQVLELYGS
jgi:hypothetical protein